MTEPGHPTRRPQTEQAYLDRGRALQRRAVAQHPKAEDSIHALVLMFSKSGLDAEAFDHPNIQGRHYQVYRNRGGAGRL